MTDHRKIAVIYTRVATRTVAADRRHTALSGQEGICRAAAEAQGYEVAEVFRDYPGNGRSLERPGFQKMFTFLDAHRDDAPTVFIADIHRLARSVELVYKSQKMIAAHGGTVRVAAMDRTRDEARIERERE